ncbi:hypothetical protein P261_00305 [Lachnospiraceae bacterium TWA4]|nr:hypothetical protein P261_00305 [Lachnospiraceae bacterium TWA4]
MFAKKIYIKIILLGCFVASVICGVRFSQRKNDFILNKDFRTNGILKGEENYRKTQSDQNEVCANFSVESYHLVFNITTHLNAVATLQLANVNLDSYTFILYHGYKIYSVLDEKGNNLSFTRDGDYLNIESIEETNTLTISYSGNGNKYYVNHQGIALPGYFSYYPIPGYRKVWDNDNEIFNVNTEFEKSKFNVEVYSNRPVYSNLSKIDNNKFEGISDTVSLYSGLLKQEKVNGLSLIYSPIDGQNLTIHPEKVSNKWNELCEITGETSKLLIDGKLLIYQPRTILSSCTGSIENAVVLDNQVLLCDLQPTDDTICISHFERIVPNKKESEILREVFMNVLFSETVNENVEKPSMEMLKLLKKYRSSGDIEDVDEWFKYDESSRYFQDLMDYQVVHLGKKTVMRKVYKYLKEDNHSINQVDFLYDLEKN